MAKPGPKPRRTEDPVWTSELAYFVGLIAADGCLYKDGRHINLVSKDRDLLEQVKDKMKINTKIAPHYRSRERLEKEKAWHLQFSDAGLWRWFIGIGITPRKSKTIKKVEVPDEYFSHFLRGLFDGDGCIYSYWDKRWKHSYMYYVAFASGSRQFLDWLQEKVYTLYALKGHQTSGERAWALKFSKHRARELLYVMYEDATIHLKRKSDKVFGIWDHDPQVFADAFGVA